MIIRECIRLVHKFLNKFKRNVNVTKITKPIFQRVIRVLDYESLKKFEHCHFSFWNSDIRYKINKNFPKSDIIRTKTCSFAEKFVLLHLKWTKD